MLNQNPKYNQKEYLGIIIPDESSISDKWVAFEDPTQKALEVTAKSPSIHASNSALTLISKTLSPLALTRSLSSNVFLVVMGLMSLLFSILVLMVFRFDLVGGESAGDTGKEKPKHYASESKSKRRRRKVKI